MQGPACRNRPNPIVGKQDNGFRLQMLSRPDIVCNHELLIKTATNRIDALMINAVDY